MPESALPPFPLDDWILGAIETSLSVLLTMDEEHGGSPDAPALVTYSSDPEHGGSPENPVLIPAEYPLHTLLDFLSGTMEGRGVRVDRETGEPMSQATREAPEVKPAKAEEAEERVKATLSKIMTEHEGDWDIAMDLISIREFRDTLVRRRREIGMTQSELAQTLGIKQSSVSLFENRPWPDPRLSTLRRYARALGIMVRHDLAFEVPEPASGGSADDE